jgi:beta-aspartyl-peptidase (threonine type)
VGAVACDRHGHLAAATSTGGMTNKRDGRVGDSPLIGAGTFAEDATAAISGTGMGEAFIQGVVAYDIAARCRYAGQTLPDAVSATIATALTARQAEGGVIAVNQAREIVLGFNSEGMYRGYVLGRSAPQVAIDRSGR